jgi:AcrR family transcriptional regulator
MSIVIQHEKRRRKILEQALDVFVDGGFENATYQKIADHCGITRTTLYLYFRNKREIFNYSIKQLLSGLEENLQDVLANDKLSCPERIVNTLSTVLDTLEKNRRLLSVVLDYLLYLSKSSDPGSRVRRRTIKLRHILATLVIDGIKTGELKKGNVKTADDLLYSLIESAIFRLTVLNHPSVDELKEAAKLMVKQLSNNTGL